MQRISTISVIISVLLICCPGCTLHLVDFSIISTKDVLDDNRAEGLEVKGTDYRPIVLFFPLGAPNIEDAVNKALKKSGEEYNALANGKIEYKTYWFLLFGWDGYLVQGIPITTQPHS